MNSTPVVYEPSGYQRGGYKREGSMSRGTVIGLVAIGALGLIIMAGVIAIAVKKGGFMGDGNQIQIDNVSSLVIDTQSVNPATLQDPQNIAIEETPNTLSHGNGAVVPQRSDYDMNAFIKEKINFEGIDSEESGSMASIDAPLTTGGIMNDPKVASKKWNPKKMVPNLKLSARPEGSLASKYGPSQSELAVYLPTTSDMWKSQPSGARRIRKTTKVNNDPRASVLPKLPNGFHSGRGNNLPRVNEAALNDQMALERRQLQANFLTNNQQSF